MRGKGEEGRGRRGVWLHTGLGGTVTFHGLRMVYVWEEVKTATAGRRRREHCSMAYAEQRTVFD